ncbi:methyl-accepting chemotaxis protein [Clostridium saccharoperbutylacetonicum]|uniref:Methyl-accepting chemotaxis sensory transducer n=1 Tax=Clostridium saccharoperbutylacetonicum N1-4(HMT) TaxID=931276 RepID=M1MP48_9CLOT|nr:methyl-accepting chemotaxis protein [Clostridium saccharoperbutylacetonicum]AGF57993.1 methyl-accepting chemotaxis sensory transducer [Clostridium saccharoperbutylacetonicum N1-4(HMT)]NRT61234.1 methyl-accepting chemotaxis protein [Clostridium saccharoperbutylacetonicum]NSB24551.1 methyl-accepting chemotaxis protein [Clostridium saccharoperbutylacetonicum]NSB43926.1 methyl-accepting chemotaxis protein [Clostridium saccharoperbutylacetonicum]
MLKNIKIINSIVLMVILSTIVSLAIAIVGYSNMKTINNNSSSMYENALVRIVKTEEIRQTFSNIRLNANRISISDFNADDVSAIDANYSKMSDLLNDYENLSLSSLEKNNLAEFKSDSEKYYSQIKNLEKGNKLYGIDLEQFNQLGVEAQLFLDNLVTYSSNMANTLQNDNINLYLRSTKIFFATFIIGFILMIFVSSAIVSVIKKSMKEIISVLNYVADGDFSIKMDSEYKNEFGIMKRSIKKTISNISLMLESVKQSTNVVNVQATNLLEASDQMSSSAQEINAAVQEVASAANDQSSDLINVKTSLDNFADSLNQITLSINDVNSNLNNINSMAEDGNSKLKFLFDSVKDVNNSFNTIKDKVVTLDQHVVKVNNITTIINSIADETDLLALNAAIESARAGEVGKGFSVVAEEIRKLAEQSKISANDITNLISSINKEAQVAVKTTDLGKNSLNNQSELIEDSIKSFALIFNAINTILPKVNSINKSIENINVEKDLILSKALNISGVSEENAASAEEISASVQQINISFSEVSSSAQTLSNLTNSMIDEVAKFKL